MPSDKKLRLDLLLIELNLFASREIARTAIMDGGILVNGQKITKPGVLIPTNAEVTVTSSWKQQKYVSRGGQKLEKALAEFDIDPKGHICLDIGASTGGFTDCLLQHGASRVYAIDVGYGQLDWSLRQDNRVIVKERMNARLLKPEMLYLNNDPWANLAVIDVSFISLLKILPVCLILLDQQKAELICLIKPQFEAGRKAVGKGGVVKSKETHMQVIETLIAKAAELGLATIALTYSPIKGPAGNIEYLIYWVPNGKPVTFELSAIVTAAFKELETKQ